MALVVVGEDQSGACRPPAKPPRMARRMNSFFLSQTGIAVLKLRNPLGA